MHGKEHSAAVRRADHVKGKSTLHHVARAAGVLALGLLWGCSGGQAGDPNNRGPFELVLATTGFSQIYPHRITELDSFGNPSERVIDITSLDDLKNNVSPTNSVLPVGIWPDPGAGTPQLPGSSGDGNHFLLLRFSHELRIQSILSDLGANVTNSGLTNNIQVLAYDPATESVSTVKGRGFVGGWTYYDDPTTPGLDLQLVHAVGLDASGAVVVLDSRANGFPLGFPGDTDLVQPNTFVFVPDENGDGLTGFESFPKGKVIRILATSSVLDFRDKPLIRELCTGTTVGKDTISPEVLGNIDASAKLQITPGGKQVGVDPATTIRVSFSKPVQPRDVGEFFSTANKTPDFRGVVLQATVTNTLVQVIYYADPLGYGDFCNYTLTPAYVLLGETLHTVQISNTIRGLAADSTVGSAATTEFTTGEGPAITNAPVSPEVVYIGRGGSSPGVSVMDLNGFGQGTGDFKKVSDPNYRHGYKMNPNLRNSTGIVPPRVPSTGNLNAGTDGALTLIKDSKANDLLLDDKVLANVGDIEVGQGLDKIFNNVNINLHVGTTNAAFGWGNPITFPPTPNPPRLRFDPPPNPAFNIFAEEPSVATPPIVPVPPCTSSPQDQLVQGNPFSTVVNSVGLFYKGLNLFYGPQPVPGSPPGPILPCPYYIRQQIGHFLYVLDRRNKQIRVVNSNRFQIIETIQLPDPWEMAMAPNLTILAVTNFSSNSVSFIDTDPASPTFHKVIKEVKVGKGPTGLAWQPEGEDLLVVNTRGNSLSVIGGADLDVRKTLINQINQPLDVAVTLRPVNVGWNIQIYHAYILSQNGRISMYESGPDGPNGIGFDDVIGSPEEAVFRNASTLQPDISSFNSAVWVAHQDATGLGQISHLELASTVGGPLPINQLSQGFIFPPNFRDRVWKVTGKIGGSAPTNPKSARLSGNNVVDIALDEMQNNGILAPYVSSFISNIKYALHSGKGHVKITPTGALVPATTNRMIFAALADSGRVDVLSFPNGEKIRTIDVPGVRKLRTYWSQ
ncbi:MAG: hypothetical protein ACE5F1_00705 [Planctomycetota bacterium]